jgi:hypothetical protein
VCTFQTSVCTESFGPSSVLDTLDGAKHELGCLERELKVCLRLWEPSMNQVALKKTIHAMPFLLGASRHMILSPVRSYFRYFPVPSGKRFLWRNVACHVRWLEYWTTATTLFGSKLHVDPRDDVGRCIYYFGVWEPNLTAWITRALSPGDTFVDVGAHVGYFSTLAAGIVKEQGSVVSIEGMPRTCDLLRANYQLNGIRNGRIVPMAVWDAVGNIEMFGPSTGIFATSRAKSRFPALRCLRFSRRQRSRPPV